MSARGRDFVALVPPTKTQPKAHFSSPNAGLNVIRDNFELTTWLLVAALAQGLLILAVGRLALTPAAVLLLYRGFDTYAQTTGLKRNTYMDGILEKKFSTVFPDEAGNFGKAPAAQGVVVLIIGVQFNHPMGIFAPHAKRISADFSSMITQLEKNPDEFGFLGASAWNSNHDASKNQIMSVCYFRDVEGLHQFAHSKYHMPAWLEWNKNVKETRHITIFHETYHAPAGHWESIYVNSKISNLASTVFKIPEAATGEEVYQHPIVDASKGLLKTSAGRMARSQANEHDKLELDPYDV